MRFFNTTGPCQAEDHYMLPPEGRMPDLLPFVKQKLYFVVHAARQTGKSTAMIALAHLSFMAFLQRVVNGGGQVMREYAAGRGAVDLVVHYGPDRFVVEIKRVFTGGRSPERVREEGVAQLGRYLDDLGEPQGWLVIFDQRPNRSWNERLWREERHVDGRTLWLIGG